MPTIYGTFVVLDTLLAKVVTGATGPAIQSRLDEIRAGPTVGYTSNMILFIVCLIVSLSEEARADAMETTAGTSRPTHRVHWSMLLSLNYSEGKSLALAWMMS